MYLSVGRENSRLNLLAVATKGEGVEDEGAEAPAVVGKEVLATKL